MKKPAIKSQYIEDRCPICGLKYNILILDSQEQFSEPEAVNIDELRTRRVCNGKCNYQLYD